MPEYGLEFYNEAGNLFIGVGEKCYLYWGTKSISHTFVNPSEADKTVDLFNLPINKKIMVFLNIDQNPNDAFGFSKGEVRGGKWQGVVEGGSDSGTYHFMVFVPVDLIPLPDWGVATFDDNGNPTFHTARPPLQIKEMRTVTLGDTTQQTFTYNIASLPSYAGKQANFGGPSFRYMHSCVRKTLMQVPYGPDGYDQRVNYINASVGVIDKDFYTQFSNLGNYPL